MIKHSGVVLAVALVVCSFGITRVASGSPEVPLRAAPLELSPAIYLPVVFRPENTATPTSTATATATSTATPTFTPTPTNTSTATATPTQPGPPQGANVVCHQSEAAQICAWVDRAFPSQNMSVTVSGRLLINNVGQTNQTMNTTWHYKTVTSFCSGFTDIAGTASCSRTIGRATIGYQVNIDVNISGYGATTWFIPQ